VIEDFGRKNARTLPVIDNVSAALSHARDTDSLTAVGGMVSKVEAANVAVRSGIPMVIASGRNKNALKRILAGEEEGTLFVPKPGKMRGRKRWIAFFHHPKGTLYVDDGARKALRDRGKSLLPPGVARCEGDFEKGDVLRICDLNGTEFARGLAAFDGKEIRNRQLKRVEIIHRDNLVIL
jgi:glutamate 5-kinase